MGWIEVQEACSALRGQPRGHARVKEGSEPHAGEVSVNRCSWYPEADTVLIHVCNNKLFDGNGIRATEPRSTAAGLLGPSLLFGVLLSTTAGFLVSHRNRPCLARHDCTLLTARGRMPLRFCELCRGLLL